jgi:microcystin-dependent protein
MDNYIGEIRPFAFGIIPRGWQLCDGSLLTIQQNQALYALIGTTYGGDGTINFALPDLRGRAVVSMNPADLNYKRGTKAGAETVTLTASNIPVHTHAMEVANNPGNKGMPTNRIAIPTSANGAVTASLYSNDTAPNAMLASATLDSIGGAAHNNMQPFLTINYCIATMGAWPSRED